MESRLKVLCLTLYTVNLFASPTLSQEPYSEETSQLVSFNQIGIRTATVSIENKVRHDKHQWGTGVIVGRNAGKDIILTANHVIENPNRIFIHGFNTVNDRKFGDKIRARLIERNTKYDVALLLSYEIKGTRVVPLATKDAELGSWVELWGYGPSTFWSRNAIVVDGYKTDGINWLSARGPNGMMIVSGDSGGPFVQDGKVVGIGWGTTGFRHDPKKSSAACRCSVIRKWIKDTHPDYLQYLEE